MGLFQKIKNKFAKQRALAIPAQQHALTIPVHKLKLALEIAIGKKLFSLYDTEEQALMIKSASGIMTGSKLDEFTVDNYESCYAGAVIALYGEIGEVVELDQQHNNLIDTGFINKAMQSIKPIFKLNAISS